MACIQLLDGSVGQELVKRSGAPATPMWSNTVMLEQPDLVRAVHMDYFKAGATLATTNTYMALYDRIEPHGYDLDHLHRLWAQAIRSASDARADCMKQDGIPRQIAGAIGPLMASYRPDICPPAAEAALMYADIVTALSPHVDLMLIETMCSLDQADGALRATQKSLRPVWLAVSVQDFDGTKLRSGEPLTGLRPLLDVHRPDAILLNCARPEAISEGLTILATFGGLFGAYANGFTRINKDFLVDMPTVDVLDRRQDLTPETYADFALNWVSQGARIIGGCCEVGPDHIRAIAHKLRATGHDIL